MVPSELDTDHVKLRDPQFVKLPDLLISCNSEI